MQELIKISRGSAEREGAVNVGASSRHCIEYKQTPSAMGSYDQNNSLFFSIKYIMKTHKPLSISELKETDLQVLRSHSCPILEGKWVLLGAVPHLPFALLSRIRVPEFSC